jgi:peptidoglycan biosynthesis protein MviN/MurJ (putative lipid II flippase)
MATSTKKASLYLFILRFVRMIISVITLTFTARFFGVSMERDVWILVVTLITTIIQAMWGPINEIFRAKFVFIQEKEGSEIAVRKTGSLFGFIIWVTIFVSLALYLFSTPISEIMTRDLETGAIILFVNLFMWQIPTLLLNELTNIGISILNAYEVYYIPEVVGFFSGIVNLLVIILLAPTIGIYSLLIGTYVGIFFLLFAVIFYLNKLKINVWRYIFSIRWTDVKLFILFSLPFYLPYFVGQFNAIFERVIAGMLGTGNISSVEYARQFITILQSVLSSVLTTIMVPVLAKQFINKMAVDFNKTVLDNLQISMLIYALASIFLISSATPLCDFFFNRGKIDVDSMLVIKRLTQCYGLAFFGVIVYIIMGMVLLSSNQGKYYAIIGVITQICVFAFNLIGVKKMGVYVLPTSLGIVHLISGILMLTRSSIINHRRIVVYIFKSVIGLYLVLLPYFILDYKFNYNNSFLRLLYIGLSLLLILPILCSILGFDIKSIIRNIIKRKNNESN